MLCCWWRTYLRWRDLCKTLARKCGRGELAAGIRGIFSIFHSSIFSISAHCTAARGDLGCTALSNTSGRNIIFAKRLWHKFLKKLVLPEPHFASLTLYSLNGQLLTCNIFWYHSRDQLHQHPKVFDNHKFEYENSFKKFANFFKPQWKKPTSFEADVLFLFFIWSVVNAICTQWSKIKKCHLKL